MPRPNPKDETPTDRQAREAREAEQKRLADEKAESARQAKNR